MECVRGIASPHLWVYTGEEMVCSLCVWVKEGKEAEVKKEVETLLNEVGFGNHTVCVTSEGKEEEYVKMRSGGDVGRVIRRYQRYHCHSSDEHHHCHSSDEHKHHHNNCSSSEESDSDEHHRSVEAKRPRIEFRPLHREETTTLRLSHDAREKKLLISGGKVD